MTAKFKQPGAFIKYLADDLGLKRHRPVQVTDDSETHYLDLSELKLRTSRFTPFIIPRRLSGYTTIDASELNTVLSKFVDTARSVMDDFSVFVVGGKFDEASLRPPVEELGERGVVIMGPKNMQEVEGAPDKNAKLKSLGLCLKAYLGLRALSPYVRYRPAVAGRFFGRKRTLARILAGKKGANYTFLGNRRIGKTSILREIKDRLSIKYKSDAICFADLYGANYHNTFDVIHGILLELDPLDPRAAYNLKQDPERIKEFPKWIRDIPEKKNMAVAVFIDEVDHILAFDEKEDDGRRPKYELLNLLRSAFEHESCQIFFAGFRRAIAAANSIGHPLFNFTDRQILRNLTREETNEMVTLPLTRLGIDVEASDLLGIIYRETGGHPELIQMVCEKIIDMVADTEKVPTETELLEQLYGEEEFERTIYQTFITNTNSYERLLCCLLIREATRAQDGLERFTFREADAYELISKQDLGVDATRVTNLMQNLEVSSITLKIAGTRQWRFAVPQLERYCANNDIDSQIRRALEEAANTPKEALIDWPKET